MSLVVYPGSFDPITMGHIDIIERLSLQFSQVVVLLVHSPKKKYLFTPEERMQMVTKSLEGRSHIKIDQHDGLTVDYMKKINACILVRGLRTISDFESEININHFNKKLAPHIETFFIYATPQYGYISSRGVKELAYFGGSLKGLVPDNVIPFLEKRIRDKKK